MTVGNAVQGFDRLMRAVETLKKEGLPDDIVVQYGNSRHVPKGCDCKAFVSRDKFGKLIFNASLVITHGGAGSIGLCLNAGKKPVVVPRRRAFDEIVNDHQMELLRELESQGRVYGVRDISELGSAVRMAMECGTNQLKVTGGGRTRELVKNFLDSLPGRDGSVAT